MTDMNNPNWTATPTQNQSVGITKAVGTRGANRVGDVEVVQALLNKFAESLGISPLKVDGRIGRKTNNAIMIFQRRILGVRKPDGRVDPNGATLRKLNEPFGGGHIASPGVHGKTAGVDDNILAYLEAVADFYDEPIRVTSGKRSPGTQASAMWNNWDKHLKRGLIYAYLKNNPKIRERLDGYFKETTDANCAASSQARHQFFDLVRSIAPRLSRHLSGQAVDVGLLTSWRVLAALKVGMTYVAEKYKGRIRCHHFDNRKFHGTVPAVTPEIMKQWPT